MIQRPHLWLQDLGDAGGDPSVLSAQERAWSEALPAAIARRYRASRSLLRRRLSPLLQCPPGQVPLESPPGQPPRLAAAAGWVSLSHSGGALLLGWSPQPIGVDLEWAERPLDAAALVCHYFPAPERLQLEDLEPSALRSAVLRSWVIKEAAIKWRRTSLAQELRHWCWDHERRRLQHLRGDHAPAVSLRRVGPWLCAAVGAGISTSHWDLPTGASSDADRFGLDDESF